MCVCEWCLNISPLTLASSAARNSSAPFSNPKSLVALRSKNGGMPDWPFVSESVDIFDISTRSGNSGDASERRGTVCDMFDVCGGSAELELTFAT